MKNAIKKYLSIMLAIAMIVSSLTYYHSNSTEVKADDLPDFANLQWTTAAGMYTDVAYSVIQSNMSGFSHMNLYGEIYMQAVGSVDSKFNEATFSVVNSAGTDVTSTFTWNDISSAIYGIQLSQLGNTPDYYLFTYSNNETGTVKVAIRIGNPSGQVEPAGPEGNIVEGKTWNAWTSSSNATLEIGTSGSAEDGYSYAEQSIGNAWWNIQTWVPSVSFSANKTYTCYFEFVSTSPKALVIDNRAGDAVLFVETAASKSRGWIHNGDGTYTYKYVGEYVSNAASSIDVRLSFGYVNAEKTGDVLIGNNDVSLGNYAAGSTITATVSNVIITPSSEFEEPEIPTPDDLSLTLAAHTDPTYAISASWTTPANTAAIYMYVSKDGLNYYEALAADNYRFNSEATTRFVSAGQKTAGPILYGGTNHEVNIYKESVIYVKIIAIDQSDNTHTSVATMSKSPYTNTDPSLTCSYNADYSQTTLNWASITDSSGYLATKYVLYRDGIAVGTINNRILRSHTLTTPVAEDDSTTYTLTFKAYDSNDNEITITNNTITLRYNTGDDTPDEPSEHANADYSEATWTKLTNNSDSILDEYYINSDHTLGTYFWGMYYPDSTIAYHDQRSNCIIPDDVVVFSCQETNAKGVWINGSFYRNATVNFNSQGDCVEINASLFVDGINVITLVYTNDTYETFAIKKVTGEIDRHRSVEQETIDYTEIDNWTPLAGTSAVNNSKAYVASTVYSEKMAAGQIRGYAPIVTGTYNANVDGFHRSTIMQGKNVFTFATSLDQAGQIDTVIVDGVEYYDVTYSRNELVYKGGNNCVYIDELLVDAAPETTQYHTITVTGANSLQTFVVKVVGNQHILSTPTLNSITHTAFLDGSQSYLDFNFTDSDPLEGTVYNVYVNYPMDEALASEPILIGQITSSNTRIMTSALNRASNQYIQEGRTYNFFLEAVNGTHTSELSAQYDYVHSDNTVEKTFTAAGVKFPANNTNGNNYIYYDLITARSNNEQFSAVNAIDNPQGYSNPNANPQDTRWSTNGTAGDPQSIIVDMYCEYHIKEIDISWQVAKAKDYEVLVSEDGTNFTKVAHIVGAKDTGQVEGVTYNNRSDKIVLPNQVEARYVKITGLTRCTVANDMGYSIWDIGIYGPDSSGIRPDAHRYYNQQKIDLATIEWQEVHGRSSINTATAYVSKALYNDATMFGDHALLGYYGPGETPEWNHINDEMDLKNVFGFVVKNAAENTSLTHISSVVIDGEEYFNIQDTNDQMVYVGGDCVYIDESLLDAGPGETNYHLVTIVSDSEDVKLETFVVKTVGSDVFSISKNATYEDEYHRNGIEFPDTKVIGNSTMNNYLRFSNVTATTTDDARQGAQYAIDNFGGTRWESKWGDDYSPAESIVIDLGAPYHMKELDISWERANAKNFTIEYSTDGINYTEATTVKNAKASELVDGIVNSDRVDYIVFPTTYEARYIRLTGQYRNLTEVGKYGYSIWEMAVYGPSDSAFLELNNDNGLVLATWPKEEAADSYKLLYTSGGVDRTITINDPSTTSQYFNDNTGYPDNGTNVVLKSYNDGVEIADPFSVTALADLYVDAVTLNNGEALLVNETGNVVLTIKNKGTAWIDTNVTNFEVEASASDWSPAKSVAGGKANLKPDMTDSVSITFEDFSQASVGMYTIEYAINTKTDGAEVNPEHYIHESYYGNNEGTTDVEVKSSASYKKNDGVTVEGFQIRTNREPDPEFDGSVAFRTVCKAPNIGSTITVGGEQCTVTGFGTIYVIDDNTTGVHALNRLNSTFTFLNENDVIENAQYSYTGAKTINGVNKTYGYVATQKAVLSSSNGYTYYATTMQGMDALMANSMIVRSFVMTDHGIVYGTASARTSVAEIAYYLHRDSMTDNNSGHDYLYDAILHSDYVVESMYHLDSPFEYGWNKILYGTEPND